MARSIVVSQTGVGTTTPIILANKDPGGYGFAVGIGVAVQGTVTFSVQHTFDDPFVAGWNPATATWFTPTGFSAQTANTDGGYTLPVRAVRLNVTAGTGTATMTVVQGGL